MENILALLDEAIDDLARGASSRCPRQAVGGGNPTGSTKTFISHDFPERLPVIPVLPVPKQESVREPAVPDANARIICDRVGQRIESPFSTTGSTGRTGSIEDSCGVFTTRKGSETTRFTGRTGSIEEFRGFLTELDPERPPGDVPPRRWRQFIADARAFLASGFAAQAEALGWTPDDLFGCDDRRPYARIDRMGLVWLLNGDRLLVLTADAAVIETRSGGRATFRRKRSVR